MGKYTRIGFLDAMELLTENRIDELYFKNDFDGLTKVTTQKVELNRIHKKHFYRYDKATAPEYPDNRKLIRVDKNMFGTLFINYDPEEYKVKQNHEGEILLKPLELED